MYNQMFGKILKDNNKGISHLIVDLLYFIRIWYSSTIFTVPECVDRTHKICDGTLFFSNLLLHFFFYEPFLK